MTTDSRRSAAGGFAEYRNGDGAAEALDLMARALALLDAHEAPADAGAYLDLAMHRLRDWAGTSGTQTSAAPTGTVLK
jgi:hypothetical protein